MSARLLRLELRRNATGLLLPLLAGLLWVASPYGRTLRAPVAVWSSRSLALQGSLQVTGPFVAGIAAWMAGRESRRGLGDLVGSTARGSWSRRLTVMAAAAAWSLALYLAAAAVLFGLTAGEATWGGPVWWPVAVGGMGVLTFSVLGFAVGLALTGRFTAPLLAISLVLFLQITLAVTSRYLWVSPARDSITTGSSVFYGVNPGLAVTQIIFGAGIAALGIAAVAIQGRSGWRRSTPRVRAVVATWLAVGGIAAVGVGLALAGTARDGAQGVVIPALNDAAAASPISYTPACDDRTPIPVCVHPAYRSVLRTIAADLAPLTAQIAGLPGAPARLDFVDPGTPGAGGRGSQVVAATFINSDGPMTPDEIAASVRYSVAAALTGFRQAAAPSAGTPGRAQLAVLYGLTIAAGNQMPSRLPAQIVSAAHRFASLPAATRRAWLARNLSALRERHILLPQLP